MERNFQRVPVAHGSQMIGSRRGTSSHQYNPAVIFAEENATEESGSCYGMVFVYSGGFQAEAEKDQFNQTRAVMGMESGTFCYPLEEGETLVVPETVLTYSAKGLEKLFPTIITDASGVTCAGGKYRDEVRTGTH